MPYYLKTVVIFLVILLALRLMGRKAIAQVSTYDLAVILVMSTVVSEPLVTKDLFTAVYGTFLLAVLYLIAAYLIIKVPLIRRLILPHPVPLIVKGRLDQVAIARTKLTVEELLSHTREQGHSGPQEIEWAVMEPTGRISFLPKASARPTKPPDFQLQPNDPTIPLTLIIGGVLNGPALHHVGRDEEWLQRLLKAKQLELKRVLLAQLDEKGDLWLYLAKPRKCKRIKGVLKVEPSLFTEPFIGRT